MQQGYIRLYRCMLDKGWSRKPDYVAVWVYILMRGSYKEQEVMIDGKIIIIQPGQFVTSRRQMSINTGVHESKIQRILSLFENELQVKQEARAKYRIITILNWDKYQAREHQNNRSDTEIPCFRNERKLNESCFKSEHQNEHQRHGVNTENTMGYALVPHGFEYHNEQQMNSKRTADEQQMNTDKEGKKERRKEGNGGGHAEDIERFKKLHFQTCGLNTLPPLQIIKDILDSGKPASQIQDVYEHHGGDIQKYRQRNITESLKRLRDYEPAPDDDLSFTEKYERGLL